MWLISAPDDQISKAELRLTDIADALQEDWVSLAEQLGVTNDDITKIQTEYNYTGEQALVMLHLWVQQSQERANGTINSISASSSRFSQL